MVKRGFTLIELLVVISIIALLLSILMPALRAVKEQASGVVCVSHHRSLMQSYMLYCGDNEDKLLIASVLNDVDKYDAWVHPPTQEDGTILFWPNEIPTLEDRLRGIRKGTMFKYNENIDLYHCTADKRVKRGTVLGSSDAYKMYRSYSIQGGLNGQERNSTPKRGLLKFSQIPRTATTYVFVEQNYDGAWANNNGGSWLLGGGTGDNENETWWDAPAAWHNSGSTLSYADGHAVKFKWEDDRTVDFAINRFGPGVDYYQPGNPDLEKMVDGYAIDLPRSE